MKALKIISGPKKGENNKGMEKLHKEQTINECGAFGGIRIGKVLGENSPQHHFVPHRHFYCYRYPFK
jgi:hypothetical protein